MAFAVCFICHWTKGGGGLLNLDHEFWERENNKISGRPFPAVDHDAGKRKHSTIFSLSEFRLLRVTLNTNGLVTPPNAPARTTKTG